MTSGELVRPATDERSSHSERAALHENVNHAASAGAPKRPLVHIPVYCVNGANDHNVIYMVELTCACLDSFFSYGNDYDLLVTTNDSRPLEILQAYRKASGHRFETRLVTQHELLSTFRASERALSDPPCVKMLFSKFFPILKRLGERIVHVDFDTIFTSKVDFEPLLGSGVRLVRPFSYKFTRAARSGARFLSGLLHCQRLLDWFENLSSAYYPASADRTFFRMDLAQVRPRSKWLNSGVFSVEGAGFDCLRQEVEHYLAHLDLAITSGLNDFPDEMMMNALAVREPEIVSLLEDHNYNFLAYQLMHEPDWETTCKIMHFHGLKPNLFRAASYTLPANQHEWRGQESRIGDSLYVAEGLSENLPRIASNTAFHLAGMIWFLHVHAAARGLPHEFPVLQLVPLDVARREHARLTRQVHSEMPRWASSKSRDKYVETRQRFL